MALLQIKMTSTILTAHGTTTRESARARPVCNKRGQLDVLTLRLLPMLLDTAAHF